MSLWQFDKIVATGNQDSVRQYLNNAGITFEEDPGGIPRPFQRIAYDEAFHLSTASGYVPIARSYQSYIKVDGAPWAGELILYPYHGVLTLWRPVSTPKYDPDPQDFLFREPSGWYDKYVRWYRIGCKHSWQEVYDLPRYDRFDHTFRCANCGSEKIQNSSD